MTAKKAAGELLLEVRCEEIPARMLEPAVRELGTRVFEKLMALRLAPREVETGFTPRRLVLALKGLPAGEPDREERVTGPPVSAAFDESGKPTAAAIGFAKRCGLEVADLDRVQTPKGEYIGAVQQIRGRATGEVLAELLPRILTGLSWPKSMRWGTGVGPWARPVHGVVALLDGEVVPFELFGVASGAETTGHPVLSPEPFEVKGYDAYRRELAGRGIEIGFDRRRETLLTEMRARAKRLGGELVEDDELLDRLSAMCATPGVIEGEIEPAYLELPREILIASLRDHQSALTVERDGKLLPAFLTVMDRSDDPDGRVRAGNEWVVAARLSDARFFYEEDRKRSLEERREDLEGLTFHLQLGSYAEKSERVVELARAIGKSLDQAKEESEHALTAARLLKVDLATEMVKEFTSLQGVMGGIYAREEGLPEPVWRAIYQQYRPATAGGEIPEGRVGQVVALADRIDSLVGILGLGLVPSGSKDPFGLRRAAQGVVGITLGAGLPLDLDLIAARSYQCYGDRLELPGEEVLAVWRPFLFDRVRHLLGLRGYAYDEIEAALAVGANDLTDLAARVEALHEARDQPGFLEVVRAAKRIANILRDAPETELVEERLVEDAEKMLFQSYLALKSEVDRSEAKGRYDRCLRAIAGFADVLDRFFVEVLVMDENLDLRNNRIALLQAIRRVLSRTASLTEMVVEKRPEEEEGSG